MANKIEETSKNTPDKSQRGKYFYRGFLKNKLILFVLALTILALIVAIWRVGSTNHVKVLLNNSARVEKLSEAFNCSPSALNSVKSDQPNTKALQQSIELLNYKASCSTKNQNYNETLSYLQQENTYCKLAKDEPCQINTAELIKNLSSALQSSATNSSGTKQ